MRMGGCSRMGLDDDFPIRQLLPVGLGFAAGLIGLSFPWENLCIIVYLRELHHFSVLQGE